MPTTATSHGFRVSVETHWLSDRSNPARRVYAFAYDVTIENVDAAPAQLVSRHWLIENASGRVEEVKGPGVVGEHPQLARGERFSYRSFCPLDTPVGSMRGTYRMRPLGPGSGEENAEFDIEIPHFMLAVPSALN
jgi:ApaG protein